MNWITKAINFGQKIKKILKKRPSKEDIENSDWTNCCTGPILKKDLEENLFVCKACGKHHRMSCIQRFDTFFGKDNYEIIKTPKPFDEDPLTWSDTKPYKDRLKEARNKTNQDCAIMIAKGNVNDIDVTVASSNFSFLGGSISLAESEALIFAVQYSIDNQTPFINFCSGGGMRMMASAVSLTKGMAATTFAINELKKNSLPYIVCITDPCAGGISASYAMTGDIIIGEAGALCAFSGRRVVQATINQELPDDFQSVEFLQKHGFIDRVVHRKDLNSEIGNLLSLLLKKNTGVNLEIKNETSENIEPFTKAAS